MVAQFGYSHGLGLALGCWRVLAAHGLVGWLSCWHMKCACWGKVRLRSISSLGPDHVQQKHSPKLLQLVTLKFMKMSDHHGRESSLEECSHYASSINLLLALFFYDLDGGSGNIRDHVSKRGYKLTTTLRAQTAYKPGEKNSIYGLLEVGNYSIRSAISQGYPMRHFWSSESEVHDYPNAFIERQTSLDSPRNGSCSKFQQLLFSLNLPH
ncbi:hypothetical protein VNO77_20151 [Canavalia gladiata]|uniref:Uncharacterized protein n=1 Tax=Canavalia gladiata TaxID=3824 RepID=A0AAN9LNT1_CANGL